MNLFRKRNADYEIELRAIYCEDKRQITGVELLEAINGFDEVTFGVKTSRYTGKAEWFYFEGSFTNNRLGSPDEVCTLGEFFTPQEFIKVGKKRIIPVKRRVAFG